MNVNELVLGKIFANTPHDVLDEWLDFRDEDPFDAAWSLAYDKCPKNDLRYPDGERIHHFLFESSNGHEIVSYVVDDLDLIYAYEQSNMTDTMVEYLRKEYEKGVFPINYGPKEGV